VLAQPAAFSYHNNDTPKTFEKEGNKILKCFLLRPKYCPHIGPNSKSYYIKNKTFFYRKFCCLVCIGSINPSPPVWTCPVLYLKYSPWGGYGASMPDSRQNAALL